MKTNSDYHKVDLIVAGAGAAGLFCALEAAKTRHVALVDNGTSCGRKLAVSGGGQANFSNVHMGPEHYVCQPLADFCAPALSAFDVADLVRRIEDWGLPWEERAHGRLFLKCGAIKLVESLQSQCVNGGCEFYLDEKITSVRPLNGQFSIFTTKRKFLAKNLALALGSPARPGLGATASGWRIAKKLGHSTRPARPALTPFIFGKNSPENLGDLAGISCAAKLTLPPQFSSPQLEVDELLFTHRGLSGPAALQASLYWRYGDALTIDFLPGQNFEQMLDMAPKSTPSAILRRFLPARLASVLLPADLGSRKNAEISRIQRQKLATAVNAFICPDLCLAGLDKAEVCSGGVAVDEINPTSMESRILKGLHVIGELLDVTGQLGGYNLHWAFASAFCAARNMACLP